MYNIHSHYETIFHALKNIVTYPRLLYLLPYGSTQPENLERIAVDLEDHNNLLITDEERDSSLEYSPMFIFYDQEPILGSFNYNLFDYIRDNFQGPFILVSTEKDSDTLNQIKDRYNWKSVYYFHHVFAAHDWYRGYRYDSRLLALKDRTVQKKYISFNRITSGLRAYRSLLIAELQSRNLLSEGYVSYNDVCSEGGTYTENISHLVERGFINHSVADNAIAAIKQVNLPLRIDYKNQAVIPNHSFQLSAVDETQESFCYLVTETCYWERKHHLTEKIFKPIISKMPFVLVGCAHNLKYLRSYGFKTFSKWIDESYDEIEDPIERMSAIGATMSKICSYSEDRLYEMLQDMEPVLEHNYNLFYSNGFLDASWQELLTNIKAAVPN